VESDLRNYPGAGKRATVKEIQKAHATLEKEEGEKEEIEQEVEEQIEKGVEFEVTKILDMKMVNRNGQWGPYYLIKWKGYGNEYNTWEPPENLTGCTEIIDKYHRQDDNIEMDIEENENGDEKEEDEN
jgi:hypothetical protein